MFPRVIQGGHKIVCCIATLLSLSALSFTIYGWTNQILFRTKTVLSIRLIFIIGGHWYGCFLTKRFLSAKKIRRGDYQSPKIGERDKVMRVGFR